MKLWLTAGYWLIRYAMRMTWSLVLNDMRLAASQLIISEPNHAPSLSKPRKDLKQRLQQPFAQCSLVPSSLAKDLQRIDSPRDPAPRTEGKPDRETYKRQYNSPDHRAPRLPNSISFGRCPMDVCALRER